MLHLTNGFYQEDIYHFSYIIVADKFNEINQRNLHVMHRIRNYEYDDSDDSDDIKEANV